MKLVKTTEKIGLVIASFTLVASLSVMAQESKGQHDLGGNLRTRPLSSDSFIQEAAQMNQAEIRLAELASQKAQNAEVREYAAKVEKDHKKAQDKLEGVAKTENVSLSTDIGAMHQMEITRLQQLDGNQFERQFAEHELKHHAKAISKLQRAASELQDTQVKAYASEMLTELRAHQHKAREVAKAVGLDEATIASIERATPEGVGTSGASSQIERRSSDQEQKEKDIPQP